MKFARYDNAFNKVVVFSAYTILFILGASLLTLIITSIPALKNNGLKFFYTSDWDPMNHSYGVLPFLYGTLVTSLLALFISLPFSLAIALCLGEYYKESKWAAGMRSVIELMAGIPSVIYGFWGSFFLVPIVREIQMALEIDPYGVGLFTASLILAIMIIPYTSSLASEIISMVPTPLKEAGYALGSTRFEVITRVIVPYAKSGVFAGILLALGRALGETMAVTMVIGNMNSFPESIFSPGNTMASIIANEFSEATDVYLAALMEVGLTLFVVSFLINYIGNKVIRGVYKSKAL